MARHHSKYVSHQDVIHKCLSTYYGELFQNMPFIWYVDRVPVSYTHLTLPTPPYE